MTTTTIILIISGIALLFLLAIISSARGRPLSPAGISTMTNGELSVEVRYSRPSVRGRLIFGTKEDKALLRFGKYWRLGANRPTTIVFNQDVIFAGHPVAAGNYHFYAIPGKDAFEMGLNRKIPYWGWSAAKAETDAARISVPVRRPEQPVEQFTIALLPNDGITVRVMWSNVMLDMPVRKSS
jgi:hypothetical protein